MAPQGVIVGGWEYVIAAYAVTVGFLGVYAVTLVIRSRRLQRRTSRE